MSSKENRKDSLVLTAPVCFALFPVLTLYAHNMSLVPFAEVIGPAAKALGASILLCAVLSLVFRSLRRGACITSVVALLWFMKRYAEGWFGPLDTDFDRMFFTAVYGIVGLGVVAWVCKLSKQEKVQKLIGVVGLSLFATSSFAVFQSWNQIRQDLEAADRAASGGYTAHKEPAVKPDILYIILDGYGRHDSLKKYMNFDNSEFLNGLQKLGFYVAPLSHSNYTQTLLSLSSSTNAEYFQSMLPGMDPKARDNSPPEHLILKNRVAYLLRKHGYLYIGVNSSMFAHMDDKNMDRLYQAETVTGFQTLVGPSSSASSEERLEAFRGMLRRSLDSLDGLVKPESKPRFIFAHLMCPHPPFAYGPNGENRKPDFDFEGLTEGPQFRDKLGANWLQDYQEGYSQSATFIGRRVLKTVSEFIRSAKTPPIIIVQGDHGSRAHMDEYSADKSELDECTSILNAYYVPKALREQISPSITPVNSFRLVLNYLFDTKLPLLEEKNYFSGFKSPYDFQDVTGRISREPLIKEPSGNLSP